MGPAIPSSKPNNRSTLSNLLSRLASQSLTLQIKSYDGATC